MSLDVYLVRDVSEFLVAADLLQENGFDAAAQRVRAWAEDPERLYEANITHNLGPMAEAAGLYHVLWRPDEAGLRFARDLVPDMEAGLAALLADPDRFRRYDAPNGWGVYEHFVPFVRDYLEACKRHPDAGVEVSR